MIKDVVIAATLFSLAAGAAAAQHVRVFNGDTFQGFTGGVFVASGDVGGDGQAAPTDLSNGQGPQTGLLLPAVQKARDAGYASPPAGDSNAAHGAGGPGAGKAHVQDLTATPQPQQDANQCMARNGQTTMPIPAGPSAVQSVRAAATRGSCSTATRPPRGDFDGDGDTDGRDFSTSANTAGDANGDGSVSSGDYNVSRSNYGSN